MPDPAATGSSLLPPLPLPAGVELVTFQQGGRPYVGWWEGRPDSVRCPWVGGVPAGVPVRRLVALATGWTPREVVLAKAPPSVPLEDRVGAIRFKEMLGQSPAAAVFDPAVWAPVISASLRTLSPRQQQRVTQAMQTWPAWLQAEQALMSQATRLAARRGPLLASATQPQPDALLDAIVDTLAPLIELGRPR